MEFAIWSIQIDRTHIIFTSPLFANRMTPFNMVARGGGLEGAVLPVNISRNIQHKCDVVLGHAQYSLTRFDRVQEQHARTTLLCCARATDNNLSTDNSHLWARRDEKA